MRRRDLIILLAGAMTAARALRAQQKAMPVIGFLTGGAPDPTASPGLTAFRQGLSETGYVVGQNVAIEYRGAEGHSDRMPALAADLVGRKVDLIATNAGPLSELAPQARVIALLVNPNNPSTERIIEKVQEGARVKGVQLV